MNSELEFFLCLKFSMLFVFLANILNVYFYHFFIPEREKSFPRKVLYGNPQLWSTIGSITVLLSDLFFFQCTHTLFATYKGANNKIIRYRLNLHNCEQTL